MLNIFFRGDDNGILISIVETDPSYNVFVFSSSELQYYINKKKPTLENVSITMNLNKAEWQIIMMQILMT